MNHRVIAYVTLMAAGWTVIILMGLVALAVGIRVGW